MKALKILVKKILSIFGLQISWKSNFDINKSVNLDISFHELDQINKSILDYLQTLSLNDLSKRVEIISCNEPSDPNAISHIHSKLKENGILVVPNFMSNTEAQKINLRVDEFLNHLKLNKKTDQLIETEKYVIQGQKKLVNSYDEMANYSKPIINIRSNKMEGDKGMVDIFNADYLFEDIGSNIRNAYNKTWLVNLLRKYDEKITPANLNIYINESVTKTRGFHVDIYKTNFKGFIYLTDVETLDDSPYCFVKKTHSETPWRKINKLIGKITPSPTDAPFLNPLDIVPVLGKKGTLVLSDQSGVHRGLPQKTGAVRKAVVFNYKYSI